jgi:hypothetical protein
MKNGIYGFHFMGIYCEAKFKDDKVIDAYVDYYKSEIPLHKQHVTSNLEYRKVVK